MPADAGYPRGAVRRSRPSFGTRCAVPELDLSVSTTQYLAVVGNAAGALAILLALLAHLRFRRLRRDYEVLQGDDDSGTLLSVVRQQAHEVRRLQTDVENARRELGGAREDLADAIRH